eukprot:UN1714
MYRVDLLEDYNVQDLSPLSQRVFFRSLLGFYEFGSPWVSSLRSRLLPRQWLYKTCAN